MTGLERASLIALRDCLGVKPDESLLVVTDDELAAIGRALLSAGRTLTDRVLYLEIPARGVPGSEPPPGVAEIMARVSAVVAPTSRSLTHTEARRAACAAGARVATMPGITEDTLVRCLDADVQRIARRADRVAEILTRGKIARVTNPAGTDVTLPIEGIRAIASRGLILEPGQFGNLPSGEAYLMPVEGAAQGTVVVDGAMAAFAAYELGDDPKAMKLDKLYVRNDLHGRGYGSMLMRHVQDQARGHGCTRVYLQVNKNNRSAIEAYLRNGFTVKQTAKLDIGGGFYMDDYVMSKNIGREAGG